jgi:hypothetical protein
MEPDEFESLERPELFGDPLHLNEAGGIRFSTMLTRAVSRMLNQPRGADLQPLPSARQATNFAGAPPPENR